MQEELPGTASSGNKSQANGHRAERTWGLSGEACDDPAWRKWLKRGWGEQLKGRKLEKVSPQQKGQEGQKNKAGDRLWVTWQGAATG